MNTEEIISKKKCTGLRLGFLLLAASSGCKTLYIKSICVMAIKTRFGQRTSRKNALINFRNIVCLQSKQKAFKIFVYTDVVCMSIIHLFCSFITFSITSRTQPSPPLTGDIYFEIFFISATASAGQQARPQYCITS